MRHRKAIVGTIALIAVGACARNPKPKQIGDNPTFAPGLEVKAQERGAPHLLVKMAKQAYINAFLVTPGEETMILYPTGSASAPLLDAGPHELATNFGPRPVLGDSGRILRRPTAQRGGQGQAPPSAGGGGAGGGGRGQLGFNDGVGRWILVYASQDSIPLDELRQKVVGFTVPGYTVEALNTVARPVHSLVPHGQWAAVAVEYDY